MTYWNRPRIDSELLCPHCGENWVRMGEDGRLRWNICRACPERKVTVENIRERLNVLSQQDGDAGDGKSSS